MYNLTSAKEKVGCNIEMSHDKQEVSFRHPLLIRSLEDKLITDRKR
jgi:hypothetical protein